MKFKRVMSAETKSRFLAICAQIDALTDHMGSKHGQNHGIMKQIIALRQERDQIASQAPWTPSN